jgi:hypothetical protein
MEEVKRAVPEGYPAVEGARQSQTMPRVEIGSQSFETADIASYASMGIEPSVN